MTNPSRYGWNPANPLVVLLAILGVSAAVTACWLAGGGPFGATTILQPANAVRTVIDGAAGTLLNDQHPGSPAGGGSLLGRASGVADESLTVAESMVDSAGVAVDAGGRVVRFGADLVERTLAPSVQGNAAAGAAIPATPARTTVPVSPSGTQVDLNAAAP